MSTASWRFVGISAAMALTAWSGAAQSVTLRGTIPAVVASGDADAGEQPDPPRKQPSKSRSEELDAVSLLARVTAAYAEAATHERVAIRYAGPDGSERFDQMQVSLDPGKAGGGRRLAVSMGSLRVQVVEGLVSAVSESAVGRVFRAALGEDLSSRSLKKVLPPLPIPSLEFLGGGDVIAGGTMTPYASGIVWESMAEPASGAGQTWAVVRGSAGDTRVAMTIDLQTWRVRHVEILGKAGAQGWSLDCAITPIAAPERDPWAPMADSLQPVATLAELVAAQLPIQRGATVPSLTLMDAQLKGWTLNDAFGGARPRKAVGLVLYRAGSEAARADAQSAALTLMQTARRLHIDVEVRPVLVYELREFQVTGLQRESSQWDASVGPLASTGGRELMDRFAPGRNSAVVLIDPEHKLVDALDCDGRSSDAASLGASVRDALTRSVPAR